MVEFLQAYWFYLYAFIVVFFDILILVIKRRPKTLDDFTLILNESCSVFLPVLINKFEEPGNGENKKIHVIDSMRSIIFKRLGRKMCSREEKIFNEYVSDRIESILSTPQKKELK